MHHSTLIAILKNNQRKATAIITLIILFLLSFFALLKLNECFRNIRETSDKNCAIATSNNKKIHIICLTNNIWRKQYWYNGTIWKKENIEVINIDDYTFVKGEEFRKLKITEYYIPESAGSLYLTTQKRNEKGEAILIFYRPIDQYWSKNSVWLKIRDGFKEYVADYDVNDDNTVSYHNSSNFYSLW